MAKLRMADHWTLPLKIEEEGSLVAFVIVDKHGGDICEVPDESEFVDQDDRAEVRAERALSKAKARAIAAAITAAMKAEQA